MQFNVKIFAYLLACSVDRNNDGDIDASELQAALSNGTWLPFNPDTVKLMISKCSFSQ
jgi:hypothetical protein